MLKCHLRPCLREPQSDGGDSLGLGRPAAGAPQALSQESILQRGQGLCPGVWTDGARPHGEGVPDASPGRDGAREGCSGVGFLESGL